MQIRDMALDKLIPYARNPRKNNHAIDKMASAILEFGFRVPVLAKSNGEVIDGHLRIKAAQKLALATVPVVICDDLSEAKIKALRLNINRMAELADWDDDLLKLELEELKEMDFDIDLLGFDNLDELMPQPENEGNTDPDEIPEVPQNIHGVKRGDIWQLGEHRLMCGDSTSNDDVLELMGDLKAELCFTSPPYADQREYNGGKQLSTEHLSTFISAAASICNIFAVNLGISRKNNEVNTYWDDYIKQARSSGLKLLSWNVWNKQGFGLHVGNATAMFGIEHEWIIVFGEFKRLKKTVENKHKSGSKTTTIRMPDGRTKHDENPGASHRQLGTIWSGDVYRGQDGFPHPAMFPVDLPIAYIEACTDDGDIVYEPFCGSGSTLIACEKTGRKCVGMEIDEHYCSVIIERWQNFTGRKAEKLA